MTKESLTELLSERFYENFAIQTAAIVIANDAVDVLYDIATSANIDCTKSDKKKIIFRAAYTLETIFFNHRELFAPYTERFFNDFHSCTNESAKRHFTKMMCEILKHQTPTQQQIELICQSCVDWCIDPKVRVAVKISAIKIIIHLREKTDWIGDILPEIIDIVERRSTPAMDCNLRRWRDGRIV